MRSHWLCHCPLLMVAQGESYEDLLCKGTGQRGVAILGDSAAAHFQYVSIGPEGCSAPLSNPP